MRRPTELRVCCACWDLRGRIEGFAPDEDSVVQRCRCDKAALKEEGLPDATLSNESIEDAGYSVCPCCAAAVVNVGSRYALILCPGCKRAVIELNEAARKCVVPISRHFVVNGAFNKSRRPLKRVAGLVDRLHDLGSRSQRLWSWGRARTELVCIQAGLDAPEGVPIEEYLSAASNQWTNSQEALDAMLATWLDDAAATGALPS